MLLFVYLGTVNTHTHSSNATMTIDIINMFIHIINNEKKSTNNLYDMRFLIMNEIMSLYLG